MSVLTPLLAALILDLTVAAFATVREIVPPEVEKL
jgi:hypothetical protein